MSRRSDARLDVRLPAGELVRARYLARHHFGGNVSLMLRSLMAQYAAQRANDQAALGLPVDSVYGVSVPPEQGLTGARQPLAGGTTEPSVYLRRTPCAAPFPSPHSDAFSYLCELPTGHDGDHGFAQSNVRVIP